MTRPSGAKSDRKHGGLSDALGIVECNLLQEWHESGLASKVEKESKCKACRLQMTCRDCEAQGILHGPDKLENTWCCYYLYATLCPPLFSIFFCLLLSASGAVSVPSPGAPPIPPNMPFMPPTVVAAR